LTGFEAGDDPVVDRTQEGIMRRRLSLLAGVAAIVVAVASSPSAAASPPPSSMAALGDSITRAFNACGWYVDCASRSWSTGTSTGVNSHYLRIQSVNPAITGRNHNDARTGAKMSDLARQAGVAVTQGVEYVTILMGANDACTSSEASMTSVDTFRTQFAQAISTLTSQLPSAAIFGSSIPDIYRLWQVGHSSWLARSAWAIGGICQSMLANPTSSAQADVDRRNRVRQRVIDYNTVLAEVCGQSATCRFDGNVVFNYPFTLAHVSGWDYFHPNTNGQAVLASITYAAGFGW
jgi:lysophospholipase L1-like esterase